MMVSYSSAGAKQGRKVCGYPSTLKVKTSVTARRCLSEEEDRKKVEEEVGGSSGLPKRTVGLNGIAYLSENRLRRERSK